MSLGIDSHSGAASSPLSDVFPSLNQTSSFELALREAYEQYVTHTSSRKMAVSLKTAALLSALCTGVKPRRVLDLGSGFSSFALRAAVVSTGGIVWSVDDDEDWLQRSKAFVTSRGFTDDRFMLWDDFARDPEGAFDVVFHDLGGMSTRARLLPRILTLVAADGVLVLDDMHKSRYVPAVEQALASGRWLYFDAKPWSLDEYGRFAGVVITTDSKFAPR